MDIRPKAEIEKVLAKKWFELWSKLCPHTCGGSLPDQEWAKLIGRYCERHRAYHTLGHIEHLLGMLKKHSRLATNHVALAYAVFRHDEVYFANWRPEGLPGNEALSAAIADEALAKAYRQGSPVCTPEFRTMVHGLIMVTLHDPEKYAPKTPDEMLMADIDWSAIGFRRKKFILQREEIRSEYSDYTDEQFRLGSISFFNKALKRPQQFYLPALEQEYGTQARQNIEYTLHVLESGNIA